MATELANAQTDRAALSPEGRVFEINNGVPHRVDNDAESWRIHLLLDFVEEPVPSERRFQLKPGQECGYHELHTCDADPWAR